jgi:hypothetical protein
MVNRLEPILEHYAFACKRLSNLDRQQVQQKQNIKFAQKIFSSSEFWSIFVAKRVNIFPKNVIFFTESNGVCRFGNQLK